jgi:hypothetical protein
LIYKCYSTIFLCTNFFPFLFCCKFSRSAFHFSPLYSLCFSCMCVLFPLFHFSLLFYTFIPLFL